MSVFHTSLAQNDTWEIRDSVHAVLIGIPNEEEAEAMAREFNNAYERGRRSLQDEIKQLLGIQS